VSDNEIESDLVSFVKRHDDREGEGGRNGDDLRYDDNSRSSGVGNDGAEYEVHGVSKVAAKWGATRESSPRKKKFMIYGGRVS